MQIKSNAGKAALHLNQKEQETVRELALFLSSTKGDHDGWAHELQALVRTMDGDGLLTLGDSGK